MIKTSTMVDASQLPDLETRMKNPYEYFPYFDDSYLGVEPKYIAAVDRHSLMFPDRPRVRRNWRAKDTNTLCYTDEYFRPDTVLYPVLIGNKDDPNYSIVVPSTKIRSKNRLEYFAEFSNMSDEEFKKAVEDHAKLWPHRPKIIKDTDSDQKKVIYEGDPYPVLIAPW